MAQHTFLVEIGTAELPPKALRSLAEAFADNFKAELTKADLAFGDVEWFASPRRLALKVHALAGEQPSKSVEKRGPTSSMAILLYMDSGTRESGMMPPFSFRSGVPSPFRFL